MYPITQEIFAPYMYSLPIYRMLMAFSKCPFSYLGRRKRKILAHLNLLPSFNGRVVTELIAHSTQTRQSKHTFLWLARERSADLISI